MSCSLWYLRNITSGEEECVCVFSNHIGPSLQDNGTSVCRCRSTFNGPASFDNCCHRVTHFSCLNAHFQVWAFAADVIKCTIPVYISYCINVCVSLYAHCSLQCWLHYVCRNSRSVSIDAWEQDSRYLDVTVSTVLSAVKPQMFKLQHPTALTRVKQATVIK